MLRGTEVPADAQRAVPFEVLAGPAVLDREVLFVHYATGARQQQTDFDLPAGHALEVAAGDIAIVGRLR
ncbi:hypothetical protein [Novosphingobium sp. ST904]|uniref:hypothetical protein n=1 Tax=Novosphingobium sp. ST904 TaxID=1684385 RepID=UPI0006CCF792|nr:hypothetical protein [Novosphingobium sp. ST904]KPH69280.1 hypothetical protein ADT71_00515 [Novosphingobium sp. ST904]